MRDGGVPGVVIRLGRGFNAVTIDGERVTAGSAMLDVMVARAGAEGRPRRPRILSGIPGTIGGALRMNGGAYGGETKDVLIEARGVDRAGTLRSFSNADMGFSYRHCGVAEDVIFTRRLFQGRAGNAERDRRRHGRDQEKARGEPAAQSHRRLDLQEPARARAPGSWSTRPAAAACSVGQAQVSQLHSNFLISLDGATASDIETLGETVRARVKEKSGVDLEWEIKRIGVSG